MQWKIGLVAAFAVVAIAGGWRSTLNPVAVSPAFAKCDPEDRIDGSTANDAKRKMEAAGYTAVRDLKKGCDNYWHAIAVRDRATVRVVLSPAGEVLTERD